MEGWTEIEGIGFLTYQRAIDIARNTEGRLHTTIHSYLEQAISDIWLRINAEPHTYVLSKDEFSIFNYFIRSFHDDKAAEQAVARYWRYAGTSRVTQEKRNA